MMHHQKRLLRQLRNIARETRCSNSYCHSDIVSDSAWCKHFGDIWHLSPCCGVNHRWDIAPSVNTAPCSPSEARRQRFEKYWMRLKQPSVTWPFLWRPRLPVCEDGRVCVDWWSRTTAEYDCKCTDLCHCQSKLLGQCQKPWKRPTPAEPVTSEKHSKNDKVHLTSQRFEKYWMRLSNSPVIYKHQGFSTSINTGKQTK